MSQSVTTAFENITTATVQEPLYQLKVSWLRRKNSLASFAEIDSSTIDGPDIIQGEFSIITPADLFEYFDESDRVLSMRVNRWLNEPYGGLQYARASVVLENLDSRFSQGNNSTIGTAILPKRPMTIQVGYKVNGIDKTLPQFKGIVDKRPEENQRDATLSLEAYDYLSYLNEFQLESAMYTDIRTDQLIEKILIEAGFNTTQYVLDSGLNTIGFAWFKKNDIAGARIRDICESEEASFYQDEWGVLRFENRRKYIETAYTTTQHTIDKSDIIDLQDDKTISPINRCVVRAKPREVQSSIEIWRTGIVEQVSPSETKTIWASFEDPVTTISTPVATTDYLANSAQDGSGIDKTGQISVTMTTFAQTAKLEITNNDASDIYITSFRLRGTPATITSEIEEIYEDTAAQNKYGEVVELEIDNDFINTESFAYYIARAMVNKYKDSVRRIKVMVQAIPKLQLRDKVSVQDINTDAYTSYRVVGISTQINGPQLLQTLTLREITDFETDSPATIDTSTIDGPDIVWI